MTVSGVFQKLMRAIGYRCSSEVARMHVVADVAVFAAFFDVTVITTGWADHKTMFSMHAPTTAKSL
jgi:hypothetical protein